MRHLSRREFVALTVAGTAAGRVAQPFALGRYPLAAALTAHDLVERIKAHIGVDWKNETVDTFKMGDPSTAVTGIVTTSMATLSVLQQAVKAGANLIITAQPTFYSKADSNTPASRPGGPGRAGAAGTTPDAARPPSDPVYRGKNDFITRNNLVVFRLSDHWKLRKPDPIAQGLGAALGWTRYEANGDPLRYDVPPLTLEAVASHVKKSLGIRGGLRVIGDPQLTVRRIGLLPGTTPIQASLQLLPTVDAIIAGEVREWESAPYVQDLVYTGGRKGFMTVGRVVDEEPGMDLCARWLKTIVAEVPIRHIAAGDPYWRPV